VLGGSLHLGHLATESLVEVSGRAPRSTFSPTTALPFPLAEVAAAHEAARGRDIFGRVVLTVRGDDTVQAYV